MKKILSLAVALLLLGVFVSAQEFGAIRGTVRDSEGNPLPGVSVTLTGSKIAAMSAISSERGNFRFMNLPVANDYTLKLELSGFKPLTRQQLSVSFGRDITLDLTMEQAVLEEEVTVVGQTPVIDTKRTQVGVNVTEEMIMSLPTARNPWVIMSLIPGMLVDREDVGGNEGGQQSAYYGHGGGRGDQTWNVDGANITDNSALGAAPAYLNIASYEELQVNYGNNDVKSQTGGVQVNLVSKRGGNAFSGTFYLDAEDKRWQADNVKKELKDIGYTAAGVDRVYLYGANFGGPILRDKAWFYLAWGIQDINARTLAGTTDKTWLASGYAKMNFQLTPSTRLEGFVEYDNKEKWGRTAWDATQQGPETVWNQTGPGYIWKGEIDHTMGNIYLNLKGVFINGGFNLQPVQGKRTADGSGKYMIRYYYPEFYVSGNIDDYGTDRDQINVNFSGNLFLENVLGGDHEWKFGVDYVTAVVTTFDLYEGNLSLAYWGPDPSLPTGEWWEAWLLRDYKINYGFNRYSFFLQDTATFGRLTFNLGLRYDMESSVVSEYEIPASPWLPKYMPALKVSEIDPGVKWKTLSPRLSLVWDIFGTGKDIIKFSVARYGSQSGFGLADFINPVGWTEIDVIWQDLNHDGRVTSNELFGYDWDTGALMDVNNPDYWLWYSGFDPDNPTSLSIRNKFDPNFKSPLLDELTVSYEKEIMTDFAGRLEFFYKKQHHEEWTIGMLADGTLDSQSNYYAYSTEPITGYTVYGRKKYYPYSYRTNYPNLYTQYMAGQIVFSKRLSNKWMMDASFTYSDWKQHWKGDYIDPQYVEYYDGGVVAPGSGGSGLSGIYVNSRWQGKLSGLVQLPYGINFSGVFVAREGYVKRTDVLAYRPGIGTRSIYGSPDGGGKFGDERLPAFWVLNLRAEKLFRITDTATVALGVDGFNITNSAHALKQEIRMTSARFGQDLRILNPRVFRFGVRFTF
ncbi:MAG: carboxypeptidase regulatory-like domain-containing protein [Clostridiales bacterium]|nr:carboxypeptidase regulatory-like domain-containing protein [Clostridiales bacterium]